MRVLVIITMAAAFVLGGCEDKPAPTKDKAAATSTAAATTTAKAAGSADKKDDEGGW